MICRIQCPAGAHARRIFDDARIGGSTRVRRRPPAAEPQASGRAAAYFFICLSKKAAISAKTSFVSGAVSSRR